MLLIYTMNVTIVFLLLLYILIITVEINVLNKYVELPKDDIQHKVYSLIKVRGKNKPGTKTRAPANKSILNIVVNTPGVSL